jgi:hypothetical protein
MGEAKKKDTLVVTCSGTGCTHEVVKFLERSYELRECDYDLLAVPGSIHSLGGSSIAIRPFKETIDFFISFLVEHHLLTRVVAIDHDDCAWFSHLKQTDPAFKKVSQREMRDTLNARLLKKLYLGISFDCWFVSKKDGEYMFEKVR